MNDWGSFSLKKVQMFIIEIVYKMRRIWTIVSPLMNTFGIFGTTMLHNTKNGRFP